MEKGEQVGGSVSIFLKPQLKAEKHPDYTPQDGYEDMFWGKIKVKRFFVKKKQKTVECRRTCSAEASAALLTQTTEQNSLDQHDFTMLVYLPIRGVTMYCVTVYHNTKMQQYVLWTVIILCIVQPK